MSSNEIASLWMRPTTAYKAVMKPVEGTILTVLRGLRDGAAAAAAKESDLGSILRLGLKKPKPLSTALRDAACAETGRRGGCGR